MAGAAGGSGFVGACLVRQPILTRLGFLFLALAVPAAAGLVIDPRTVAGDPSWLKPGKFLLSLSLYAFTMAWFYGYVAEERRAAPANRALVATVVATSLFEALYIALQAARGQLSHFNVSDGFHSIMYSLMGLGALALTATAPWLAREIARHGTPALGPVMRRALILGLTLTFVLGVPPAALMGAHLGHAIGGDPGGATLPLLGWARTGGDLRPAHFIGIHAMQAIPLLGWAVARRADGVRIVTWGAILYSAVTLAVLAQALMGLPLFPA